MANPSVNINLQLTSADLQKALADIKKKIQSALGNLAEMRQANLSLKQL